MKLLSTAPLTALSATFFTWYAQRRPLGSPAGGASRAPEAQGPLAPPEPGPLAAATLAAAAASEASQDLRAVVEELGQSELQAHSQPPAEDSDVATPPRPRPEPAGAQPLEGAEAGDAGQSGAVQGQAPAEAPRAPAEPGPAPPAAAGAAEPAGPALGEAAGAAPQEPAEGPRAPAELGLLPDAAEVARQAGAALGEAAQAAPKEEPAEASPAPSETGPPPEVAEAAPQVLNETGVERVLTSDDADKASTLFQDAACFLADGAVAYMWQLPLDSASSRQCRAWAGAAYNATAEFAAQTWRLLPSSAADLWERVPSPARAVLLEARDAARRHLRRAFAQAAEACPPLAEGAAALGEAAAAAAAAAEAAGRAGCEHAAALVESTRGALAGAVRLFLRRHPEHEAALGGLDPLAALAALLLGTAALAAEALRLVRLAGWAVRGAARLATRLLCAPLCCCRRRAAGGEIGGAAAGAPGGLPHDAALQARRARSRSRLSGATRSSSEQPAAGKAGLHETQAGRQKGRFQSPPRWVPSKQAKGGA